MSKERLVGAKSVRQDIKRLRDDGDFKQADIAMCYLVEQYGDFLVEQAERVQELEEEVSSLHWRNEWIKSQEQNKRYREMLETVFQADDLEDVWNVEDDYRALEGEE